jgi:hypothetical protein
MRSLFVHPEVSYRAVSGRVRRFRTRLRREEALVTRGNKAGVARIERSEVVLVEERGCGQHRVLVFGRDDRNELARVGDRSRRIDLGCRRPPGR